MRRQSGPAGLGVARPDPPAKARRASKAVSMQTPRTDIGSVKQRTFIITAMPRQARLDRELITIIRPPSIYAQGEIPKVARPIIVYVQRRIRLLRDRGAEEVFWRMVDVQYDFE